VQSSAWTGRSVPFFNKLLEITGDHYVAESAGQVVAKIPLDDLVLGPIDLGESCAEFQECANLT
jgi:hypothetical protein